jgi:hypothetical protein
MTTSECVTPAQAGVQVIDVASEGTAKALDSGLRRNDEDLVAV